MRSLFAAPLLLVASTMAQLTTNKLRQRTLSNEQTVLSNDQFKSMSTRRLKPSKAGKSSKSFKRVDVCIIGAGPSGVQAAYSAEKKGLTTALFDKNLYVGGKTKMKTFPKNSPDPYRLAAALYSTTKHSSFQDLIEEFEVFPEVLDGLEMEYFIGPQKNPSPDPSPELVAGIGRYVAIRNALADKLDNPQGLLSDYDTSLNVSLLQWLLTNDLLALFPLFWTFFTAYGYGHPSEVPAIYALKYLPSGSFLSFVGLFSPETGARFYNFQSLLEAMVSSLQGPVFLDTKIEHVTYASKFNIVNFRTNGGPLHGMKCDSIIIAFAPTQRAMVPFTPAKKGVELTSVFGEVVTFNYRTILYNDDNGDYGLDKRVLTRVPITEGLPDEPAENLFYFKQQPFLQSMVLAYYLSPTVKSDEEALDESMQAYGTTIGKTVTSDRVEDFYSWEDYFPHVSKASLDNKFYQRFDQFQGHASQYYVGGLFNFEMVQDSMEHAKSIMDRFF